MHKEEKDIPYKVYARVVAIADMPNLSDSMRGYTPEQVTKLKAWLLEWDPRTEAYTFFILETDDYRMPDEVQRLYGKRYLRSLNTILQVIKQVEGERLAEEVFGTFA
jgi:hypothetical protein